ncbi:MAG: hypothetical protein PHD09_06310 [Candidatus Omnitrophica bacterium]|jgi:hypothetical protein|nr:hypothetical protein [Candidatus Omnitrophota bacterium]
MKKTKILTFAARFFRKNYGKEYPQLWHCLPKTRWIRRTLQWLCREIGGHEASDTEWGYSGGDFADTNCRWCNAHMRVQKTVIMFRDRKIKRIMDQYGPGSVIPASEIRGLEDQ